MCLVLVCLLLFVLLERISQPNQQLPLLLLRKKKPYYILLLFLHIFPHWHLFLNLPHYTHTFRMFHAPKKPSSINDRPMCVQADSGLVLTTDPKPRLRWTVELHERFVDAVTQLGGPDSTYPNSLTNFSPPCRLCFFVLPQFLCRGHSQDDHESHGRQGPHSLPSQEPPPGLR